MSTNEHSLIVGRLVRAGPGLCALGREMEITFLNITFTTFCVEVLLKKMNKTR